MGTVYAGGPNHREVSAIAFVAGLMFMLSRKTNRNAPFRTTELLQSMGLSLWRDGSDYLENSYLAYELEPVEDPEADWRLDVYTGTCRLPVIINDYMTARSDAVDEYHKDGIAVGFLCYPLEGFTGEERSNAILDFRDDLRGCHPAGCGSGSGDLPGRGHWLVLRVPGFHCLDLPAVLTAAQAFLEGSGLPYAHFHAFRRDVGGVPLLDENEPEPDIHEETGSLLAAEDIKTLESFDEGGFRLLWENAPLAGGFYQKRRRRRKIQRKAGPSGFADRPLVFLCLQQSG